MSNAMQARKAINDQGFYKVSFNDMVVKATAMALRKHPAVNSSWLGDRIRYNEHVHIGVAVAVEDGLLVPVVRFADGKSFAGIGRSNEILLLRPNQRSYSQKIGKEIRLQFLTLECLALTASQRLSTRLTRASSLLVESTKFLL